MSDAHSLKYFFNITFNSFYITKQNIILLLNKADSGNKLL